jgi:zinc/manganese transport system substrate-binding protein
MKYLMTVLMTLTLAGSMPLRAQDTAKKQVMVTLAVLKSIADEVAGGDFEVTALSKPDQDPHSVTPTPSLMKKVRDASLLVEIGLQLELWADAVADGSGNGNLARGAKGRLVASQNIPREEIPRIASRSEGDVHPEGNPHIWTDPLRAKAIAENIAEGLKGIEPGKAEAIDKRLKAFKDRIDEAVFGADLVREVGGRTLTRKALDGSLVAWLEEKKLTPKAGGWIKKAEALRGAKVLEYHKTWIYLAKLLDFEIVGSVQVKPGIEPGPKHIAALQELIAAQKVKVIIVDAFYDPAVPRALERETGARVAIVSNQPEGDYFKFIDGVIGALLEAAAGAGAGK